MSTRSTRSASSLLAAVREAMCHDPLPVGGVAVGLMLGTYALLGLPISLPLLLAAGCGAALVYGADRVLAHAPEDRWNRPDRVAWVRTHRRWLMGEGSVLAILSGGALLLLRPTTVVGAVLLGAVAVGRYALPEKWAEWAADWTKPLLIAGVWAAGATALPMIEAKSVDFAVLGWLGGYRTLLILPNVLLSDWGDRRGDRAAGRPSWAPRVRQHNVRWGATLCLLGALVLSAAGPALGMSLILALVDAAGAVVMLGGVWSLDPTASAHRLVLDLIVGWPAVTFLVAWGIG